MLKKRAGSVRFDLSSINNRILYVELNLIWLGIRKGSLSPSCWKELSHWLTACAVLYLNAILDVCVPIGSFLLFYFLSFTGQFKAFVFLACLCSVTTPSLMCASVLFLPSWMLVYNERFCTCYLQNYRYIVILFVVLLSLLCIWVSCQAKIFYQYLFINSCYPIKSVTICGIGKMEWVALLLVIES